MKNSEDLPNHATAANLRLTNQLTTPKIVPAADFWLAQSLQQSLQTLSNMNKNGTIIIIEDDLDDQLLLEQAFSELNVPNQRIYFPDGDAVLDYLNGNSEPTFLILCDVQMPRLNGLELRAELKKNAGIALKCVPYLYFTTVLNHRYVIDAYCESAQGFFVKPADFNQLTQLLSLIISYWTASAAIELAA
nr:response regulator [uncultured Dyadobacter sp.]